ncbi:hypothetical protein LINPERPRIM_LOCUS11346, partial [Linum perenne]
FRLGFRLAKRRRKKKGEICFREKKRERKRGEGGR